MREIKSVEMVFENCEGLDVPYSLIGLLELKGIETTMSMVAKYGKNLKETKTCKEFAIALNRGLNGSKECYVTKWSTEKPIDRIHAYQDIVSVTLKFEDGSEDEYYLDWKEDESNPFDNGYQKSSMNSYGDLFIEVSSNEELYFKDGVVDDKGFIKSILGFSII